MTGKADHSRRNFLYVAAGGLGAVAAGATAIPFVGSMFPAADTLAAAKTEFDISTVAEGQLVVIQWQGKPVFILRRTKKQITTMETSDGGKDPQADSERVQNPDWLIVVGLCTHLGCVPSRKKDGWFCPCHGSVYDNSGRILTGPAPRNLDLPPYEFLSSDKIIIGKA
mgnify:CR=1 FL=1